MAQDTAARILDAACDLIAEEGIDAIRIARVAQRAGASSGLVHHYFSTREELLEQALIHSFERAGDDRFGEREEEDGEVLAGGETASAALADAIRESLPAPGEREREWVLWVELWLRAVREPKLRPVAVPDPSSGSSPKRSSPARSNEWISACSSNLSRVEK